MNATMFTHSLGPDAHLALIEPHHAARLHALVKDSYDHLREWSNWLKDPDLPIEHTQEWVVKNQQRYASGDGYEIGIWYEGEMAGQIGYNYFEKQDRRTEIGYWLGKQFVGKGLVTRACTALIENAFGDLEFNRIEIRCGTENSRSRKVAERLGFKFEGIARESEYLHDHYIDLAVYAILKSEWSGPA